MRFLSILFIYIILSILFYNLSILFYSLSILFYSFIEQVFKSMMMIRPYFMSPRFIMIEHAANNDIYAEFLV